MRAESRLQPIAYFILNIFHTEVFSFKGWGPIRRCSIEPDFAKKRFK